MLRLKRYLHIQFISAEPESVLSKLSTRGIELNNIVHADPLTVNFLLERTKIRDFSRVFQELGLTYQILKKEGALWYFEKCKVRPVLTAGFLAFFLILLSSPNRIYRVEVDGNETMTDKEILFHAEKCGIQFGITAREIRSEEIKNRLLSNIPQLQWAGITTSGTVATIHVKERSSKDMTDQSDYVVSNIVAVHDGIITEQTVFKGTPLYQVGQSVRKGDILVSGYTDCGTKMKAERATGEVFAHTTHKQTYIVPQPALIRGNIVEKKTQYMLRIGKKVINLYNHSGIMDAGCVKMYSEDYWSLPGGFHIPISLIKTEYVFYDRGNGTTPSIVSCQWLEQYARNHLISQMVAGSILDEKLQFWELDGAVQLTGEYACKEMIGIELYEGNIEQYAENS